MSSAANPTLDRIVESLGPDAVVLDVGGWDATYPLATHVVDIMPYETRRPRGVERFTKETWIQADVTEPTFRLPFEDKQIDFAICMHTLEDLHEVRPLLRELTRTARRGYIETPARLMEQTIGVVDRTSTRVGFNHHKWIVDLEDGRLVFHDKHESFYQPRHRYAIPLVVYERHPIGRVHQWFWQDAIAFELCADWTTSRRRAAAFKESIAPTRSDELRDAALRAARRVRRRLRGQTEYGAIRAKGSECRM